MQSIFAILCLTTIPVTWSQTCGPRVSPRLLNEIPCDMSKTSYCQNPGPGYPYSSVRRYIYENQGLMRRMYGDQRQSFVVRNEIEDFYAKYDSSPPFTGRHPSLSSSRKSFLKFSPRSAFKDTEDEPSYPPSSSSSSVPSSTQEPSSTSSTTTTTTTASAATSTGTDTPASAVTAREVTLNTTSEFSTTELPTNLSSESSETTTTGPFVDEPIIVPLPSSTSSPEEAAVIDETKKGFNACPVVDEIVAPYWANSTRGEILALLNVYPFEQYVRWEKCQFEWNQMYCRDGCRCEQKYRLHRLLAFDPKNECRGVFADWFKFPSTCVCVCYNISLQDSVSSSSRSNQRKTRL